MTHKRNGRDTTKQPPVQNIARPISEPGERQRKTTRAKYCTTYERAGEDNEITARAKYCTHCKRSGRDSEKLPVQNFARPVSGAGEATENRPCKILHDM